MTMAADRWYIYYGREGEGEVIPPGVTRVRIHESLTVIPANAFAGNRNIEEVDCHDGVKTVEEMAFWRCTSLRRVIMPGVKVIGWGAFCRCETLEIIECGKLEIIGRNAFCNCKSLTSINLPSAKIVELSAFWNCTALTNVIFGKELERIEENAFLGCKSLGSIDLPSAEIIENSAFYNCTALAKIKFSDKLESIGGTASFNYCPSLELITIPLKDGMIADDDTFQGCDNLKHVDLVEGEVHDTIAYLQLEEWKNDMNEEINSINQILSNAPAGDDDDDDDDVGGKARAIRMWIRSVLGKIIHYKAQHQRALEEAAAVLQLQVALPQDIVMKNVIPFLELPSYTFEVGDHEDEEDDSDSEDDVDDFDDDESSY